LRTAPPEAGDQGLRAFPRGRQISKGSMAVDRDCLKRADTGPIGAASSTTGVPAIAAIPSRADHVCPARAQGSCETCPAAFSKPRASAREHRTVFPHTGGGRLG
jgi:hypothetical protein